MALETELATYTKHLPEWREQEGRFVLIHGDAVVDFFGDYRDALRAGYRQFGLEPFLVKQVHQIEQVQFVSRSVDPTTPVHLV
ncbi:MAG TPA: hypothetical protein VNU46_03125 [Gemmatimonadaceae bacterium]|jgi:hypothetical protein|nr:hypothetical protein [Gemmatimonadaceae bacterium]